ncbi:hypothetical protein [Solicola sp. PLA-1-18]|uniref:hypothetical protein n=1 Tax=Solicola sp. PLA-1-18 TaxID=3380532 RepID=UPI003B76528D
MKRALMVLVVAAVAVGLVASPASAQTKTRKDKVGDAAASFDLRSAVVSNRDNAIVVKTRFTKVTKRRTAVYSYLTPRGTKYDQGYVVDSYPISKGRYRTVLFKLDGKDSTVVPCSGVRSTWKKGARGLARVVVPQSCLGDDAGTLEVWPVVYDNRDVTDSGGRAAKRVDTLKHLVTVKRG